MNIAANNNRCTFKIEERRRKVGSLLAQSMTEAEIAQELNVDQSTISRDVKVLKELSQQFIYDLAKSDLAYYYKQSIDGIEEAKREAWRIYNDNYISAKGQAEHASEFALSEALRDIIAQEQDREIDLKDALGLR